MSNLKRQIEAYQEAKAWHRGTGVRVTGMSLDQQLTAAGLDWEVKTSGFSYGDDLQHYESKNQVAYRADTGAFLDTYNHRRPWQNRDIVGHFNDFCEEGGLTLTHLGSLEAERTLYAAAYIAETDVLSTGDITDHYLILKDSHINGNGLTASLFSNRCVCTNGMHETIREGNKTIAHLGEYDPARVSALLDTVTKAVALKNKQSSVLAEAAITKEEAIINLIKAFGTPGLPVSEQPKVVQTTLMLFEGEGKGSELLTAYNTAYGLLQSVSEYFNWHGRASAGSSQFQSVLSGSRGSQIHKFERQLVGVYVR